MRRAGLYIRYLDHIDELNATSTKFPYFLYCSRSSEGDVALLVLSQAYDDLVVIGHSLL